MTELADSFFKWLKFEKRASAHTILAYEGDLRGLKSFLEKEAVGLSLENASQQHLRFYLLELGRAGLEPSSIARKIAAIKAFFRFLLIRQYRTDNPAARLRSPRQKIRNPDFIEVKALSQKLEQAQAPELQGFEALRDMLIVELLYGTGMRLSELIGLRLEDIDLKQKQVKVLGKRSKIRWIPIHTGLAKLILSFLPARTEATGLGESGLLITTKSGKPAYPVMVRKIVKEALEGTTSRQKKSPHTLRHSFATHLLDNGAEINAIKELLGHASLAATQVYTHNTIEKLKRSYFQAHPRSEEEGED